MIRVLYNFCWYAIGTAILLAAILVTIIRLLLPDIGNYRDDIQAWVSQYMGYPVVIQSIQADWRGWTPQLYLDQVTLMSPGGEREIAEFDSAYISFSPLRSLYHRQVIPESLVISGVRLQLLRLEDGNILAIHPELLPQHYEKFLSDDELIKWLLSQPIIELQDSNIEWIDQRYAHRPIKLENARLLLRTDGNRTQISGNARLARQLGKRIEFAIDVEGKLLDRDWNGQIYMQGEDLLLASWPAYTRWRGVEIGAGRTNLKIWSEWRNAEPERITGIVEATDLLLLGDTQTNLIHSFAGDFTLRNNHTDRDWHLHAEIKDLATHNGIWPSTSFELRYDRKHDTLSGYAEYLRMEDILPLMKAELLSQQQSRLPMEDIELSGNMESVQFQTEPATGQWHVESVLRDVAIASSKTRQRLSGLAGKLEARNDHGMIMLDTGTIGISDPDLFEHPVNGITTAGRIDWDISSSPMIFRTNSLELGLSDLRLLLSGKLYLDEQYRTSVDMLASTRQGSDIETLKPLVPLNTSDEFRKWVDRALVSGRLAYADMVIRGDLASLPFRQQEGQLQINARFDDVTLDYDKDWPPLYHLEADLALTRNQLHASIPTGRIYESRIYNTNAVIGSVFDKDKDSVLVISGHIDGYARDALKFLNESPLRDDAQLSRMREVTADGEIGLQLDMSIPLGPAANTISGKLELFGNNLASLDPALELADVTGMVHFTSASIETEELRGVFHGENINLDIERTSDDPDEPTILRIGGTVDNELAAKLITQYTSAEQQQLVTLMNRVSGSTHWEVEIRTRPGRHHADTILFASDLRGLSIKLPEPLAKPPSEARSFKLHLSMNETGAAVEQTRIDYGNILQIISEGQYVSLYFGSERPGHVDRSAQLAIRGDLSSLYLDKWVNLATELREYLQDWQRLLFDKRSIEVDLQTPNFVIYDQEFPDSHITLTRQQDDWLLAVTGDDLSGTAHIPSEPDNQRPVSARLESLYLKPLQSGIDTEDMQLDPRDLPPLNLEVEDFIYGKTALGSLALKARKTPNGLLISDLTTRTSGLSIDGRGDWHAVNNEIISDFELELHAEQFADMLEAFGYSVIAIEEGETNIDVTATWPGAPTDFSLASMNGSLSLGIQNGQFLDIDPRAGRLFGLLSIQALPRRLLLDFADLYKKGLAFDRIHGNYEIREGHAYTNDLFMEGISSKVAVSGRIGLVDQDYDQIVTVTPHVSDSLPLASALFGPAGIGIGAIIFLAGQVFEAIPEQIDKLLSFQYSMTGSWQDPVIEPYQPPELNNRPQELGRLP